MSNIKGLMVLIAGPYRSGTDDQPEKIETNLKTMESYALPLFRAGHIPVLGEWIALPLAHLAGSRNLGDAPFIEIFHPIAERILQHCDAVMRIGGESAGADLMVKVAKENNMRIFYRLSDIPACEHLSEPHPVER
jgi:hypothetical protein